METCFYILLGLVLVGYAYVQVVKYIRNNLKEINHFFDGI
jgi:hypothetical protein